MKNVLSPGRFIRIKTMRYWLLLCLLSCACPVTGAEPAMPATGGLVDESVTQIVMIVDPAYIPPEDESPASVPYKTIQSAVTEAIAYLEQEVPVQILIRDGIYREDVTIPGASFAALLVLEGESREGTIITGAEHWDEGWTLTHDAPPNTWSHAWDRDWGDFTRDEVWSASHHKSAPQKLVSQSRADGITLNWEPPLKPDQQTIGYRVYRQKIGETDSFTLVEDYVEGTTWTDKDILIATAFEDHSYAYTVAAINKHDELSPRSGIVHSRARNPDDAGFVPYLARRRESVFADGEPLRMVKSKDLLEPGTYFVHDGYLRNPKDGVLMVCLPEGRSPTNTRLDIPTNLNLGRKLSSSCLYVVDKPNLLIRNLTVKYSVQHGIDLESCRNVVLENIAAIDNGGTGIRIGVRPNLQPRSENITLRNITANGNGSAGIRGSRFVNLRLEHCQTNGNNWRGAWENFTAWDRGGLKLRNTHRALITHHTAKDNQANGIWLEYNNRDVILEDSVIANNLRYGVVLEASQGPLTLQHNSINGNWGGILLANASNGRISECVIANNIRVQIGVLGRHDRPVINWETGEELTINTEHWTWHDNIISTDHIEVPLVRAPYQDWRFFYDSLDSQRNLWWGPNPNRLFLLDGQYFDLPGWQVTNRTDTQSRYAQPRLEARADAALAPASDSPYHERQKWTEIELTEEFKATHKPDMPANEPGEEAS